VYHFSTDRFISIRDLVKLIAERMGSSFDELVEVVDDRPGKDAAYLLDTKDTIRDLDWQARISLEQGIDDTIAWVDRWYDALTSLPLDYEHKA
jgi:dTDP-glucose 4,6-dehydratase